MFLTSNLRQQATGTKALQIGKIGALNLYFLFVVVVNTEDAAMRFSVIILNVSNVSPASTSSTITHQYTVQELDSHFSA